jgi:hypothetical protein
VSNPWYSDRAVYVPVFLFPLADRRFGKWFNCSTFYRYWVRIRLQRTRPRAANSQPGAK